MRSMVEGSALPQPAPSVRPDGRGPPFRSGEDCPTGDFAS